MEDLTRETKRIVLDRHHPEEALLLPAAEALRRGGLVAFPTETVYGLGVNALDAAAVGRVFAAKGRPSDNPLIVHVATRDSLRPIVASLPKDAERLMERFWPGPLTLVLPRSQAVPDAVTCGLATVAVRMPDHPVALALILLAGVPVAAPSANLSGRPSPTRAEHVVEDLSGRIDFILDGGETGLGLESTVLDLTVDPPVILRPGGITPDMLSEVIGPVLVDRAGEQLQGDEVPRSPGMKHAHYAPKAPLFLVSGSFLLMQSKVRELAHEAQVEGKKVGIMCSVESRSRYQAEVILEYGSRENLASVAGSLFATLRAFDRHGVEVIIAEGVPEEGIGLAIMNRLRKAAAGRAVWV